MSPWNEGPTHEDERQAQVCINGDVYEYDESSDFSNTIDDAMDQSSIADGLVIVQEREEFGGQVYDDVQPREYDTLENIEEIRIHKLKRGA